MVSEKVKHKRPTITWSHLYKRSKMRKSVETENRFVVSRAEGGMLSNG